MTLRWCGLFLLVPGLALAAAGGPDRYGYSWRDSDEPGVDYAWVDASGGTEIPLTVNDNTGFLRLPFSFIFHGESYDGLAVSSHGWASFFDNIFSTSGLQNLPSLQPPIAPLTVFGAATLGSGTVHHLTTGSAPERRFVVSWTSNDFLPGMVNEFQLILHEGSRRIDYQYRRLDTSLDYVTVGMESPSQLDGLQCLFSCAGSCDGGTDGFALREGLAVSFTLPESSLPTEGSLPLSCGTPVNGNTVDGTRSVLTWPRSRGAHPGAERLYHFDLTETTNVELRLTGLGERRMDLLVTSGLDEWLGFIAGDSDLLNLEGLEPGRYHVLVDSRTPADEGEFGLELRCASPEQGCRRYEVDDDAPYSWFEPASAGIPVSGELNTGLLPLPFPFEYYGQVQDRIAACSNGWASFTDGTSVDNGNGVDDTVPREGEPAGILAVLWDNHGPGRIQLDEHGTAPARVFVITWDVAPCPSCTDNQRFQLQLHEDGNVVRYAYEALVAEPKSATVGFESPDEELGEQLWRNDLPLVPDLSGRSIELRPLAVTGIACDAARPLTCGETVDGTIAVSGATSAYDCEPDAQDAGEAIYRLEIFETTGVRARLSGVDGRDVSMHLLADCVACGLCVTSDSDELIEQALQPGVYYLVVDGHSAADAGSFQLSLECVTPCFDPGANERWTSCTEGFASTFVGPGTRPAIDETTTSSPEWVFDDSSFARSDSNYCRDEPCTFDMYVVAECGTEMVLPLLDVESGTIRIFDLSNERYVELEAESTGGWSAGPSEEISWEDCEGDDPLWNDQVTRISFRGDPTLCGLFRIEFENWGAFIWFLYANCDGSGEPGFRIYDSACAAELSYQPRPEISVSNLSVGGEAPTHSVSVDLSNTGCAPASPILHLESFELGGTRDLVVEDLMPGETRRIETGFVFASTGTGQLRAWADFYDEVEECSESIDNRVACAVEDGARELAVDVVSDCVAPAPADTGFEVDCTDGSLVLTWDAAAFPSGSGRYDLHRSETSFDDALASPAIASGLTELRFDDDGAPTGPALYYVLVAEDDTTPAMAPCPAGPTGNVHGLREVGPLRRRPGGEGVPPPIERWDQVTRPDAIRARFEWTLPPEALEARIYRSTDPSDLRMHPSVRVFEPGDGVVVLEDDELPAPGGCFYYKVRSLNDCGESTD
ncbi:MAG: hypothetical protein AAF533_08295 [Acidobacteriota bacterium]